jgi:hypothetical protein
VVPHFRFKKDLILYLNSSRAAPKIGISVSLQQAAGNSNLNKSNARINYLLFCILLLRLCESIT